MPVWIQDIFGDRNCRPLPLNSMQRFGYCTNSLLYTHNKIKNQTQFLAAILNHEGYPSGNHYKIKLHCCLWVSIWQLIWLSHWNIEKALLLSVWYVSVVNIHVVQWDTDMASQPTGVLPPPSLVLFLLSEVITSKHNPSDLKACAVTF